MYTDRVPRRHPRHHELLLRRAGADPGRGRRRRPRPDVELERAPRWPCSAAPSRSSAFASSPLPAAAARARFWLEPAPEDAGRGGAARGAGDDRLRAARRRRAEALAARRRAAARHRRPRAWRGSPPGSRCSRPAAAERRSRSCATPTSRAPRSPIARARAGQALGGAARRRGRRGRVPRRRGRAARTGRSPARRCSARPRRSSARRPPERDRDAERARSPPAPARSRARSSASRELQELRSDLPAAAADLRPPRPRLPRLARRPASTAHRLAALRSLLPAAPADERLARDAQEGPRAVRRGTPLGRGAAAARAQGAPLSPGRPRPGPRAARPRALAAHAHARGRRPSSPRIAPSSRLRGRGRLPPRQDRRRSARSRPDAYEAVATQLPGHAVGRGGAARRSPTTTRRTRATTRRCPTTGGCSRATPTAATWTAPPGASAGATTAPAASTRPRRSLERTARLRPATPYTPGLLYWAGRARRELRQTRSARGAVRGDGAPLQAHLPRACARADARAASRAARRPAARSRPAPRPAAEIPEPAVHARPPAAADRPARRGPGGAARGAAVARWRRPRSPGSRTPRPAAARDHGDEARLPRVHRRGRRPRCRAEVWRILYPLEFGDLLRAKARGGGPRPGAGRGARLPGVDLRRRRGEPGRRARPDADHAAHRARRWRATLGVRYKPRAACTTRPPASTSARATCASCSTASAAASSACWRHTTRARTGWTPGPRAGPDMRREEFVESIPFTETRHYVMIILANREHYRRLYALRPRRGARPTRAAAVSFRLGDFKLQIDPALLGKQGTDLRSDGRAADQLRPRHDHPALHQARRGLGADRGRRHQGDLHGQRRGARAAVPEGQGRGLDHAEYGMLPRATTTRTQREATQGPALGPHPRDPAPDRPLAARGGRHEGARRAHAVGGLRRDPGRRRHAHGLDHRRVRGAGARRCGT